MSEHVDPAIPKPPQDEQHETSESEQDGIDPSIPKPPESEESSSTESQK